MTTEDGKLHIVMFPWLAFGHMMPFLDLAKLIAQKGHKVTFVSTPRNIDRLPKPPPNMSSLLNFVKIPLPQVPNLPENAEATIDIPYDKVQYLKVAYDRMEGPMTQFLKDSTPDWILYDFAPYWMGPLAARLQIPSAFYSVFFAATIAFCGTSDLDERKEIEDYTVSPKWVPFPSTVAFRLFEFQKMIDSFSDNVSDVSDIYRFHATYAGCDVMLVRSCYGFEPRWLQLLKDLHHKPVIPVGQLPPPAVSNIVTDENASEGWTIIEEWLDKQFKGSVIYVAFGTEARLTQDELNEVALGLELSGLPFLWALRRTTTTTSSLELTQLPDGFEERTKGRGLVWPSWVPQLKILSHDSVGGYLMHSGWSSVVEAITFGKSLIFMTFVSDQGLNARILEEKKLGYPIPRNERDGSFRRESVAKSLRLVMVEEEGEVYRDKVKELMSLFGDRERQNIYIDNMLRLLGSIKSKSKKAIQE